MSTAFVAVRSHAQTRFASRLRLDFRV